MNRICGIYCIENLANKKKYFGKSTDIKQRIAFHFKNLKNNKHYNKHLQNSWNKYGEENFTFYIVEECLEDFIFDREIYHIEKHKSNNYSFGYNKTIGGEGTSGYKFTEEQIKNKQGNKNPMFGRLGKNHPAFGYKQSNEVKDKLRLQKTGVKRPKHVIDILKSFTWRNRVHPTLGRKHTDEEKVKMIKNHADYNGEKHPRFGKKLKNSSSKYFGVYKIKKSGKWAAHYLKIHLGVKEIEKDAAKLYDEYVIKNKLPNPINFPK